MANIFIKVLFLTGRILNLISLTYSFVQLFWLEVRLLSNLYKLNVYMQIVYGILLQVSFSLLCMTLFFVIVDIPFDETLTQIWFEKVQVTPDCIQEPDFLKPKSVERPIVEEDLDLKIEKQKKNFSGLIVFTVFAVNVGVAVIYAIFSSR